MTAQGYTAARAPRLDDITAVLDRIGAFAGSGLNTILGFFQALTRNDVAAPSDIGGTFLPASHSQQATVIRGDAAWLTGAGESAATIWAHGTRTLTGGVNVTSLDGNATAASNLRQSAETVRVGAAVAGTLTLNQMSCDIVEAVANQFVGKQLIFVGGALNSQQTYVTAWDQAGQILTFETITNAPAIGQPFILT